MYFKVAWKRYEVHVCYAAASPSTCRHALSQYNVTRAADGAAATGKVQYK